MRGVGDDIIRYERKNKEYKSQVVSHPADIAGSRDAVINIMHLVLDPQVGGLSHDGDA